MNNLLTKIKSWFKPSKPVKPKPIPPKPLKPFNEKHYRQLIGKLAKRAIAEQRARQKERRMTC